MHQNGKKYKMIDNGTKNAKTRQKLEIFLKLTSHIGAIQETAVILEQSKNQHFAFSIFYAINCVTYSMQ